MNGPSLMDIVIGIIPLVLLLGALWFLMAKTGAFWVKYLDAMNRQSSALERIAASLEKRAQ